MRTSWCGSSRPLVSKWWSTYDLHHSLANPAYQKTSSPKRCDSPGSTIYTYRSSVIRATTEPPTGMPRRTRSDGSGDCSDQLMREMLSTDYTDSHRGR